MTRHNPSLRQDEPFRERMAIALHRIESYPHRLRGSATAPIDSLDCMPAHRSKAYSILAYMDALERQARNATK
jgi:hypothetical protein